MFPDGRPRRSALYIPGSNFRGLDKGRSIPADVLILDLEDSVLPAAKKEARAAVVAAIGVGAYGTREVVVRVNGLESPWVAGDIASVANAGPDAILIPKVSRPEDIRKARTALSAAHGSTDLRLWAMIETPLGVLNAQAIAAASAGPGPPVACLVIGTNDLCNETGTQLQPGRALLLPWLCQILAAGRAYGLAVLDGTYVKLDDQDGLRAECRQGRDLGMDGKTLIHPKQVDIANRVFSPSAKEVEWAQMVISAFEASENADKGVIQAGGQMLERLHERRARRIWELHQRIAANDAEVNGAG